MSSRREKNKHPDYSDRCHGLKNISAPAVRAEEKKKIKSNHQIHLDRKQPGCKSTDNKLSFFRMGWRVTSISFLWDFRSATVNFSSF